ncbi:hypothetical protein BMR05_09590 [Methylococcaceae bacterium HT4]|nr:hypothetical protein BMR05_09590 [Methylococcaceae bacterium HT4]TXL16669.1 hypothetical protein BMR04_08935 [Methylococcaceae bacterium HT3]TXL19663.1 hypothetical protein BMR06_08860 [Methylococcaceae bacterium HT5]TXL20167.1 hypothetical protein BMR03_14640 [Methylococcaceae bacterium HT2]
MGFLRRRFADKGWEREDNQIFIFGFSRGSYAARRLAGLITQCGIPVKAGDLDIAWQLYLKQDMQSTQALKDSGRLFDVSIEMLGVWDTVKTTTDSDFHDNLLPESVIKGYHAMAIDEKRLFFPVLQWQADPRIIQTWFSGVHSDVGGGYDACGLSDCALVWMIDHAYKHGMRVKASAVKKLKKDACDTLHDSYDGIWKAFGIKVRSIADSAVIDVSTQERVEKVADYNPDNLPTEPKYKT